MTRRSLTEADIARGYTKRTRPVWIGLRTRDADLDDERAIRKPAGAHHCLDCPAIIPDTTPRVLCQFCERTRRLARGWRA